ncbi:MAG: porin [Pseudomonadota bacterium]
MNIEIQRHLTALALLIPFAASAADTALEQRIERLEAQLEAAIGNDQATSKHNNPRTTIGSYGELHLNKLKNPNGSNKDELDIHRFVLFMSHDFDDRTRFFSELEVEHSDTGSSGVVVLEQAYLEYAVNAAMHLKAGMMLMPVGILSETHEPPTFYGVERNPVEVNIIPTTWSEGGAMLSTRLQDGLTIDAALTSGLSTTAAANYAVRAGRQNASKAQASDAAYTGRLKWTGMPGVELAATLHHQTDITQGMDGTAGAATLYETHAVFTRGAFGMRLLYADWKLAGSGPAALGADRQYGWYAEPAWRLSERWGIFARYSRWDNRAGDNSDSRFQQTDLGVNFWPHPDLVMKIDYQNQRAPSGQSEYDGFNFGLGYQF